MSPSLSRRKIMSDPISAVSGTSSNWDYFHSEEFISNEMKVLADQIKREEKDLHKASQEIKDSFLT